VGGKTIIIGLEKFSCDYDDDNDNNTTTSNKGVYYLTTVPLNVYTFWVGTLSP
jgi:hypothetical protein